LRDAVKLCLEQASANEGGGEVAARSVPGLVRAG
jgi:hypothetical protein